MTSSNSPEHVMVSLEGGQSVTAMHYAADGPATGGALILAHGAGAGQRHPFMVSFARALAGFGVDVVTFNFPYMEQQRKLPDRAPVLEACYAAVIHDTRTRLASAREWLFIGGKSMGGRMATQLAAAEPQLPIAGLVLLGYPLHPPGNPLRRRDAHLPSVKRPMLVIQGSRDTFGTPDELRPVIEPLSPPVTLHVVDGGDHSLVVSRVAARQAAADADVRQAAATWMSSVMRTGGATPTPRP